mgnify:FL=1
MGKGQTAVVTIALALSLVNLGLLIWQATSHQPSAVSRQPGGEGAVSFPAERSWEAWDRERERADQRREIDSLRDCIQQLEANRNRPESPGRLLFTC